MKGKEISEISCLSIIDEDFDLNIQLDNMGLKTTTTSTTDVKLWAKMVWLLFFI